MAKVKLAAFAQAISGRMGGVVYKKTRYGTEMAEFEAPSNPRTASQTAVRAAFTKATQQWRTLTTTQAASWREYASTRYVEEEITTVRYRTTGFNAFVKLSAKYFAVNPAATSAPADPPEAPFNGDTITLTVDAETPGALTFTSSGANAANVTTAILMQKLPNGNADPIDGGYKIAKYHTFTAGSPSTTVPVTPGYYAVGYQFVNTATGQQASPVYSGVIGPVSLTLVGTGPGKEKKSAA